MCGWEGKKERGGLWRGRDGVVDEEGVGITLIHFIPFSWFSTDVVDFGYVALGQLNVIMTLMPQPGAAEQRCTYGGLATLV